MKFKLRAADAEEQTGFTPNWGRAILVVALCAVIGIYGEKMIKKFLNK
jgi:hypothetical protein